jgi:hypothetical protein
MNTTGKPKSVSNSLIIMVRCFSFNILRKDSEQFSL